MSKRHPSRSTVRLIPPTWSVPSRIVECTPSFSSWKAAVRPAGPAPMTTTLPGSLVELVSDMRVRSVVRGVLGAETRHLACAAVQEQTRRRLGFGALALALLVGAAFRLYTQSELWLDEALTV